MTIDREIEDQDYGCRDFDIRDPDGHLIGIGQNLTNKKDRHKAMSLAGKTLFITGASRGIGLAIALKAAADGANIAIAAKTAEPHPKLEGTIHTAAAAIEKAGGHALPLVVDVREEASVKAAIDATAAKFGGIDIVVNNASAIQLTPVAQTDMRRYDLMMGINTRGTYMVSKYALPLLQKAANPHILMLSPPLDMAEKWFAPHTAYTMAKFGMSLVVLGLAGEQRGQDRGQRAVAAHDDRHRRDQEPARRRRRDANVAHDRHHCGGGVPHLPQAEELHRQFPHRRHVPGRRRRHRFRPLPRRSEPAVAGRFLRARQHAAAQGREFGAKPSTRCHAPRRRGIQSSLRGQNCTTGVTEIAACAGDDSPR